MGNVPTVVKGSKVHVEKKEVKEDDLSLAAKSQEIDEKTGSEAQVSIEDARMFSDFLEMLRDLKQNSVSREGSSDLAITVISLCPTLVAHAPSPISPTSVSLPSISPDSPASSIIQQQLPGVKPAKLADVQQRRLGSPQSQRCSDNEADDDWNWCIDGHESRLREVKENWNDISRRMLGRKSGGPAHY